MTFKQAYLDTRMAIAKDLLHFIIYKLNRMVDKYGNWFHY